MSSNPRRKFFLHGSPGAICAEVSIDGSLGKEDEWWLARVVLEGFGIYEDQLGSREEGRATLAAWRAGNDIELYRAAEPTSTGWAVATVTSKSLKPSPVGNTAELDRQQRATLRALEAAWSRDPSQRLGQLLVNLYRSEFPDDLMRRGLFNITDHRLEQVLEEFSER